MSLGSYVEARGVPVPVRGCEACLREEGESATGLYSKGVCRCARADWSECDWSVQRCKRSEGKMKVIVSLLEATALQ